MRGIPFAVGGAFAMATYTGYWRNTKDLDLYVLPENRDRIVSVLTSRGFKDYFETKSYDRAWIYRGFKDGALVDTIWAMANQRSQIDGLWMSGPEIEVRGRRVRVIPPEAVFWDKLYIMQRERCDWPDVLNLLYAAGPDLDWELILERMGEDWPLAAGCLWVFRWLAPGCAQRVPAWLWNRMEMPPMGETEEAILKRRVDLVDTRPWFAADREKLQPAA